jgi:hypothetical protein
MFPPDDVRPSERLKAGRGKSDRLRNSRVTEGVSGQSRPQVVRNRHKPPARRKGATLGTFARDPIPGFRHATHTVP